MPSEELFFRAILDELYRVKGFDFRQYKDKCLKRRVDVRARARKVDSYEEYYRILSEDRGEFDKLLDSLTINVSEFFRNPETYRKISELIFPQLMSWKRLINIWSAGCACGEEPYSLAISALEALHQKNQHREVRILATDIDEKCLFTARKGEYVIEKLKEMPDSLVEKYFEFNGQYKIKDQVAMLVDFQKVDLLKDFSNLGRMDMIVCRNVLIYFGREIQEKVLMDFHKVLEDDGFLILGKVESLVGKSRLLFSNIDIRERVYKKL